MDVVIGGIGVVVGQVLFVYCYVLLWCDFEFYFGIQLLFGIVGLVWKVVIIEVEYVGDVVIMVDLVVQ